MKKRIISLILMGMAFSVLPSTNVFADNNLNVPTSNVNISGISSRLEEQIQERAELIVSGEEKYYNAASLQYAVSEGDNIIISGHSGVYSRRENRMLTNNNMYGIGSISKLFTTAAVLKLQESGLVDIDLPVVNYIPEFQMADYRYRQITPRMLLNHSSGIMGTTYKNLLLFNDNDAIAHDEFIENLKTQRLKSNPGEVSAYCNDGFTLAQILVERITGVSFNEYIKSNFSEPLGLENTKTPIDEFDRSKLVKTYLTSSFMEDPSENLMSPGAGGIYSSAEDICRFINFITRKDGKGAFTNSLTVGEMEANESVKGVWPSSCSETGMNYSLGWDSMNEFPFNRYGIKALCKDGGTIAFKSSVITLPDYNLTMTVLTSGGASAVNEVFAANTLIDILKEKGVINNILPDVEMDKQKSQSMPEYLIKYSGKYNLKNKLIDITIKPNGELEYYDPITNERNVYHHTYSGYFMSDTGNKGLKFVEEKNGVTYLEVKSYDLYRGLGQKPSCQYVGQKIDKNYLSESVAKAWEKRNMKSYLLVNDKYSSMMYVTNGAHKIYQNEDGYVIGDRIVDENYCEAIAKLPGLDGKEVMDYKFYTKDGVEYVDFGGASTAVSIDGIAELDPNMNEIIIDDNGYTKWFKVPSSLVGKVLNVDSSDQTAFLVYDKSGKCVNDSYVSKKSQAALSEGDIVGFAGGKGEKFNINIE